MKELRLQRISTIEAANEFMPVFIGEQNEKFAKTPRNVQMPTEQSERMKIWISSFPGGKYLDVYQYPDGRIEIRAAGASIPYFEFDKLGELNQGKIVENKRLGHVLQAVQQVQAQRDNRVLSAPSTAHRLNGRLSRVRKTPGTKTQRQLNVYICIWL